MLCEVSISTLKYISGKANEGVKQCPRPRGEEIERKNGFGRSRLHEASARRARDETGRRGGRGRTVVSCSFVTTLDTTFSPSCQDRAGSEVMKRVRSESMSNRNILYLQYSFFFTNG